MAAAAPPVHVTSADEIILQLRPSGTISAQQGADPAAPTARRDGNFRLRLTQLGPATFASTEYSRGSKVSPGAFLSVLKRSQKLKSNASEFGSFKGHEPPELL